MHWFHIIYVGHIKPPWCYFYINHPRACAFMVFEQHKKNKMDNEKMQLGNSAELHKTRLSLYLLWTGITSVTLLAWNAYINADLRSAIEVTHLCRGKSISKTQIRKAENVRNSSSHAVDVLKITRKWFPQLFQPTSRQLQPDLWMETRAHFWRALLCAAARCPQFSGSRQPVRLHLRASPRSKFSASIRRQWEGGTTGRRPLSASLGSAGPLSRHIWDMSSRGPGTVSLTSWSSATGGVHLGVNATCQVRPDVCIE